MLSFQTEEEEPRNYKPKVSIENPREEREFQRKSRNTL